MSCICYIHIYLFTVQNQKKTSYQETKALHPSPVEINRSTKSCEGINIFIYYPSLVIMPVDNNEHQRIDDVSTDRISYGI